MFSHSSATLLLQEVRSEAGALSAGEDGLCLLEAVTLRPAVLLADLEIHRDVVAVRGDALQEINGVVQGDLRVLALALGLIKEDVEKDIKVATSEEEDAIKEFETLESETASTTSLLEGEIANFEDQKGGAEQAITESESQRQDTKITLDDTIDFLKGIAPDCDYISVNFEIRKKNRWAERDGLEKAKAILSGAEGTGFGTNFLQKKGC
jgi:hypothetical protein